MRRHGDSGSVHEVAARGAVEVLVSLGGGGSGFRARSSRLGGGTEPAYDVAGVAEARRRGDVVLVLRQHRGAACAPLLRCRRLREARSDRRDLD